MHHIKEAEYGENVEKEDLLKQLTEAVQKSFWEQAEAKYQTQHPPIPNLRRARDPGATGASPERMASFAGRLGTSRGGVHRENL